MSAMSLVINEPSPELTYRIVMRLRQLSLVPGSHLEPQQRPDGLKMLLPHRVFSLSAAAAKHGELAHAAFVAWRFLLATSEKVIGSVEVQARPEGPAEISTHFGPLADSTVRAIQVAESTPDLQNHEWELRFLKISPLCLSAIWLSAARSVIVPLAPAPRWIRAEEAMTESEFIEALRQPSARPFTLTDRDRSRLGQDPPGPSTSRTPA